MVLGVVVWAARVALSGFCGSVEFGRCRLFELGGLVIVEDSATSGIVGLGRPLRAIVEGRC